MSAAATLSGWGGPCTGTAATCVVTVGAKRTDVTATFVAEKVGFDTRTALGVLGRVYILGIGAPRDAVDRARGSKRRRLTGR